MFPPVGHVEVSHSVLLTPQSAPIGQYIPPGQAAWNDGTTESISSTRNQIQCRNIVRS